MILKVVAIASLFSSCTDVEMVSYSEYKKLENKYINIAAMYKGFIDIIGSDFSKAANFPGYENYPDSVHKYEMLLIELKK